MTTEYKLSMLKAQIKRLQTKGIVPKPAGNKLARMASEGNIGKAHLGMNPDGKIKKRKTK